MTFACMLVAVNTCTQCYIYEKFLTTEPVDFEIDKVMIGVLLSTRMPRIS